jgi:hypothetical protein
MEICARRLKNPSRLKILDIAAALPENSARLWRQPAGQNRMDSTLSTFATQLRGLMGTADAGTRMASDLFFDDQARALFRLQFQTNSVLRRVCEARRISPATLPHWSHVPAVPTTAFKEYEVTSLAPQQRTSVFFSSGTTANHPSRHFHSAESLAVYEASLLPWFQASVLRGWESRRTLPILCLTPDARHAPHSSLAHMFTVLARELAPDTSQSPGPENARHTVFTGENGADGWILDFAATRRWMEEAAAGSEPVLVLGTAFSFVQWMDHPGNAGRRFQLPPGSRVMETGGYKGRSREMSRAGLHALIGRELGISPDNIFSEYGMSELSSQAYPAPTSRDAAAGLVFRFPPWARSRIISPETGLEVADGETGLIRVFDLANVWSVMAVQTGDLGVRRGDGFELLGRAALAEPRGCSLMAEGG